MRIWDVVSGELIHTLSGHTATVRRVAYSPDGSVLASASWDHTVRLWESRTGLELRTLTGHIDWVTTLAYSPGGEILA